jgi:hypothetical protein
MPTGPQAVDICDYFRLMRSVSVVDLCVAACFGVTNLPVTELRFTVTVFFPIGAVVPF